MSYDPNTVGGQRLRAERAEARVAELLNQITTMRFMSAATPRPEPKPEPDGWREG